MAKKIIALLLFVAMVLFLFSCASDSKKGYVLNLRTKKVHLPDCTFADRISSENRSVFQGEIRDILRAGFTVCKVCFP